MGLYAVFHYVLDWKLYSETETLLAEEQQQLEQHQALRMKVSIKQEATEQKLEVTQYRVDFMDKLLYQLKEGRAESTPAQ